jgi:hypothetical protein
MHGSSEERVVLPFRTVRVANLESFFVQFVSHTGGESMTIIGINLVFLVFKNEKAYVISSEEFPSKGRKCKLG